MKLRGLKLSLLIIAILVNYYTCLRLPKETKSVPVLNVKIEESDREPAILKRYTGERRMERDRLRDLEHQLESQKQHFQEIILLQNTQLEYLTKIAQQNMKIITSLSKYNPERDK